MKRPSVEAALKPLRPFQRRTVDHAFHRLFTAPDSTRRFLVADEVGLGKTLVARGIIARAVDHLWEDVGRIDIVYICSNSALARANLPKLRVGAAEHSFALATRLTMLATELAPREGSPGLTANKLNFVSFTPGTSFQMGQSTGRAEERRVIFALLEPLVRRRTALMNLLQVGITRKDRWRSNLHNHPLPIDPEIRHRFQREFTQRRDLQTELNTLLETSFRRFRPTWPPDARMRRDRIISSLRRLLAEACVWLLEPDLVILDEFQRFRTLLETKENNPDPAAELARKLFEAVTPDSGRVRTLLLSATPYKLYTADAEVGREEHYRDFLETTRFLLDGNETRVGDVGQRLREFGEALRNAAHGGPEALERVAGAKRLVESNLRDVMARTERVGASEDRDAMVAEDRRSAALAADDIRQYLAADALFRAVGDRDPMHLWKAAPYLAHFTHGYRFNDRLEEAVDRPEQIAAVLERYPSAFLEAESLRSWQRFDPGNAKLRELASELLGDGLWRCLWISPTLPYWPGEGPFASHEGTTKRLLFSAWNVVPDVVSAVLSFEAERRMFGGRIRNYEKPNEQQGPLLRLARTRDGALTRHRLFLLLLPCLPLADRAHPLAAPAGRDRREWVRGRVEELLRDPRLPDPQDGEADPRWEWAAPLLLDPGLRRVLDRWVAGRVPGWSEAEALVPPNQDVFGAYVRQLLGVRPETLGRRPPDLAELLTDAALGSPAILAARTLGTDPQLGTGTRRELGVLIADAFWHLFNQPAVIALLRQQARERDASHYWRLVLDYCRQGNLQAVLDETWHLLREQEAWSEGSSAPEIATRCARKLHAVIQPLRARVHARFLRVRTHNTVDVDEMRLRTTFALRFGHIQTEDDQRISQDAVRAAFNSPFRPFVLTSTSIGQEGLDFHPWCHRLVHWNLPGNPVDLEQREGRVHRYKGHAVRRNIAEAHGSEALRKWRPGEDLWQGMFELAEAAARAEGAPDLVPHWIAPGKHRVERHVPQLPYTTEVDAFERLKRQLAAYRVVFGQPRQEELLTLLDASDLDVTRLRDWAVDLSPPETDHGG